MTGFSFVSQKVFFRLSFTFFPRWFVGWLGRGKTDFAAVILHRIFPKGLRSPFERSFLRSYSPSLDKGEIEIWIYYCLKPPSSSVILCTYSRRRSFKFDRLRHGVSGRSECCAEEDQVRCGHNGDASRDSSDATFRSFMFSFSLLCFFLRGEEYEMPSLYTAQVTILCTYEVWMYVFVFFGGIERKFLVSLSFSPRWHRPRNKEGREEARDSCLVQRRKETDFSLLFFRSLSLSLFAPAAHIARTRPSLGSVSLFRPRVAFSWSCFFLLSRPKKERSEVFNLALLDRMTTDYVLTVVLQLHVVAVWASEHEKRKVRRAKKFYSRCRTSGEMKYFLFVSLRFLSALSYFFPPLAHCPLGWWSNEAQLYSKSSNRPFL